MTAKKKETPKHEHSGGAVCKKCGRPTVARADGSLMHDRRGAKKKDDAPPASSDGGDDTAPEPEERPERDHPMARRLFGKKE